MPSISWALYLSLESKYNPYVFFIHYSQLKLKNWQVYKYTFCVNNFIYYNLSEFCNTLSIRLKEDIRHLVKGPFTRRYSLRCTVSVGIVRFSFQIGLRWLHCSLWDRGICRPPFFAVSHLATEGITLCELPLIVLWFSVDPEKRKETHMRMLPWPLSW